MKIADVKASDLAAEDEDFNEFEVKIIQGKKCLVFKTDSTSLSVSLDFKERAREVTEDANMNDVEEADEELGEESPKTPKEWRFCELE